MPCKHMKISMFTCVMCSILQVGFCMHWILLLHFLFATCAVSVENTSWAAEDAQACCCRLYCMCSWPGPVAGCVGIVQNRSEKGVTDRLDDVDSSDHGHGTARHSTAQHSTAQHSTAQHSTAQHSTAQHSTAKHGTARHGTARHGTQHGTARHGTAQHSTARHGTARHSTAPHSTAQHSSAQPSPAHDAP